MTKFKILNRWTRETICEIEADSLGGAVEKAVGDKISLRDANLRAADLSYANLRAAILTPVRDDLWAVLSAAPKEVEGLRLALIEGRIDGSQYTGDCCCLVGTIANVRSCDYHDLGLLKPNAQRPSERFFLGIKKGDRPDTNQFSKLALEWIDTWLANMREAFGPDTKEAA